MQQVYEVLGFWRCKRKPDFSDTSSMANSISTISLRLILCWVFFHTKCRRRFTDPQVVYSGPGHHEVQRLPPPPVWLMQLCCNSSVMANILKRLHCSSWDSDWHPFHYLFWHWLYERCKELAESFATAVIKGGFTDSNPSRNNDEKMWSCMYSKCSQKCSKVHVCT